MSDNEKLTAALVDAMVPLAREHGMEAVVRSLGRAYHEAARTCGVSESRFAGVLMPKYGPVNKQALKGLYRILPDNVMLVTLPDPLGADGD